MSVDVQSVKRGKSLKALTIPCAFFCVLDLSVYTRKRARARRVCDYMRGRPIGNE